MESDSLACWDADWALNSRPPVSARGTLAAVLVESVTIVRAMWEAFVRNDVDAALEAFDPDVEWDGTNLPDGELRVGSMP